MNFELTQEQQDVQNMIRSFCQSEIKPHAANIDQTGQFPKDIIKKLADIGLMGVCIDQKYGGAGMDPISYAIVIEELSRACASTGVIVSVNNSLCAEVIKNFGTEEQKKKYLIPLAKGEHLGAYCLTEPQSGSDAGNQKTIAVFKGDHYEINGAKNWITNGPQCDTMILFCLTHPEKGNKGVTAFIIPRTMEGVEVAKEEDKLGIRGSGTATISYNRLKVPVNLRLGEECQGFKIAMITLDNGRIGIAAQALGIAVAALEEAVDYIKVREQFGKKLSEFQGLRWMIANMAMEIEAARLLIYKAAYQKSLGKRFSKLAAMAKLYASEVSSRVCNQALQMHGGYGYTKDYAVERHLRDARITEIYEGTSEIQRIVIANQVLSEGVL